MKTTVTALIFLVTMFVFACGGGETDQVSTADDSASEDVIAVEDVPLEAEVVVAPLYPEGKLDPSSVDADTPVSAGALEEAFYAWDGQTVVLQGYPYVFYGDSMTVEDELELVAAVGSTDILATFEFEDVLNLKISAGDLVTVSGTIEYDSYGDIELFQSEIIVDAPVVETVEFSPYLYDGSPLPVVDFVEIFNIWIGKELTLEGYYNSITRSTLSDGVVARIDLADPDNTSSKSAACRMAGEVSDETSSAMADNRPGTQIRGTVDGELFHNVGLVDCELVNR